MAQRKPRLTKPLVAKGWRPGVFDICWLACDGQGHVHELVDGRTIVLCVPHIKELEDTAYGGYQYANPPDDQNDAWWPWVEYYEEAMGWGLQVPEDVVQ